MRNAVLCGGMLWWGLLACGGSAKSTQVPHATVEAIPASATDAQHDGGAATDPTASRAQDSAGRPVAVSPRRRGQQHIIYIHGRIVAEEGPGAVHPEFGRYEFDDIIATLGRNGAKVHAPLRAKGTELDAGADEIVRHVQALLYSRVAAEDITVVGASQGGVMALLASTSLQNKPLRFVVLGSCNAWVEDNLRIDVHGHLLSIFEHGDPFGGSCKSIAEASYGVASFEELELHTGLRHGFLYRPLQQWVQPLFEWLQRTPLQQTK